MVEGFLHKTDLPIFLKGTDCSHRKYDCPEMMLCLALSSLSYYLLFLTGVISGTLEFHLCDFSFASSQNSCIINNAWSQYMTLHQWLWNQGWFVPWGDIWQHLEIFLVVSVGERGLIASNKQRLRMLLNNLQDIGWLLRKKYVTPMVKVPRLRSHSTEIKALTYPSAHLILITPLRWKPGQYSHSSPSISL